MADTEMTETEDYDKSADPTLHHATHEDGGADQIDITDLIHTSNVSVCPIANQSIPSGAATQLILDNEYFDRNNDFNTSTYRFTAPKDGYYIISLNVSIDIPDANTHFTTYIYKNGSSYTITSLHTSIVRYFTVSSLLSISLSQNDYIELYVKHSSAAAKNTKSGMSYTNCSIFLLY